MASDRDSSPDRGAGGRYSYNAAQHQRRSVTAADHSREQVQSALDNLLSDNDDAASPKTPSSSYPRGGFGAPPGESLRSPGGGRRRSRAGQDPIALDATGSSRHDRSPSGAISPAGSQLRIENPDAFPGSPTGARSPGGYTPTPGGGRR